MVIEDPLPGGPSWLTPSKGTGDWTITHMSRWGGPVFPCPPLVITSFGYGKMDMTKVAASGSALRENGLWKTILCKN